MSIGRHVLVKPLPSSSEVQAMVPEQDTKFGAIAKAHPGSATRVRYDDGARGSQRLRPQIELLVASFERPAVGATPRQSYSFA